jgi:hypothetical protein
MREVEVGSGWEEVEEEEKWKTRSDRHAWLDLRA